MTSISIACFVRTCLLAPDNQKPEDGSKPSVRLADVCVRRVLPQFFTVVLYILAESTTIWLFVNGETIFCRRFERITVAHWPATFFHSHLWWYVNTPPLSTATNVETSFANTKIPITHNTEPLSIFWYSM